MRSVDHIQVWIKRGTTTIDLTDGLISFESLSGFDYDQGIWGVPDSGQFTLVTRNTELDPYSNDLVRFNSQILVQSTDPELISSNAQHIFHGYVTEINVEYQPDGEPPIITISGVDLIGLLQKVYITKEQEDYFRTEYGQRVDIVEFLNETVFLPYFEEMGAQYSVESPSQLGSGIHSYRLFAKIAPKAGESVWDLVSQYATTDLMHFEIQHGEFFSNLSIYPYVKYDSYTMFYNGPSIEFDPLFSSDVNDEVCSYRGILLNDGFDRTVNQIEINNTARLYQYPSLDFVEYNETFGPYSDLDSMNEWGVSRFNLSTIFSAGVGREEAAEAYATEVLRTSSTPEIAIKEITFDANKYKPIFEVTWDYKDFLNKTTAIRHEVTPGNFIEKTYRIIGRRNSIDRDDWIMTYVLAKPMKEIAIENQGPEPILTMNATTGNSSFTFTGTVSGYPVEDIEEIYWCINLPALIGPDYYYAEDPETVGLIPGATPFTGTTFSWTYDDDGVLAPWAAAGSPYYGAGAYEVAAFILNKNGWVIGTAPQIIEVTAAQVEANFEYTVSPQGFYTFIDLSTPDAEEWTWDFGDGTTFEGQSPPPKFYTENDTYNVSLTVSNGITTDTHTVPITVNMTLIPVRYVRLEWEGTQTRTSPSAPFLPAIPQPQNGFSVFRSTGSGQDLVANSVINTVSKIETTGTFTYIQNSTVVPWNPTTTPNRIYFNTSTGSRLTVNPVVVGNNASYKVSYTAELGEVGPSPAFEINHYFTDINNMFFYTRQKYDQNLPPIKVFVSADNVNFYQVGTFNVLHRPQLNPGDLLSYSLTKTVPWPPRFPV